VLVTSLQSHDYKFVFDTPAGRWKWVTRLDVSQATPSFSVRDIVSPYGLLRDSIPIPGEIITAMAESITELRSNFTPSILVGPPPALTFTVDEGRGFSPGVAVTLTNNGTYGSILGATLTKSASYLRVTPASVGGLAINEAGQFTVEVDSTSLLATSSPYNETVTVQDSAASNSPQVFPVTVVVRPKATITVTPTARSFSVVKPLTGAFPAIADQTFVVQNTGPAGSVLSFQIQKLTGLSDWLVAFLPASDTLSSGQSDTITVSVQPPSTMLPGTYTEKLRVSGYSTNSYVDVDIQLVIT